MPLFLQSHMRLLRGKAAVRTGVPSPATERADTSPMIPSDAETCINWSRNRDMRKSNGIGVTLALRSRIRLTNRSTFLVWICEKFLCRISKWNFQFSALCTQSWNVSGGGKDENLKTRKP